MRRKLEELAIWWLERRGYFVPKRSFVGMLIGYGTAYWDNDEYCWIVRIPDGGQLVALNHSVLSYKE